MPLLLLVNTALMGGVLFLVLKGNKGSAAEPGKAGDKAGAEHGEKGGEKAGEGGDKGGGEHGGKAGAGEGSKPGPILKLEPFVIQLRALESERYIRITFDLEVKSDADAEFVKGRLSHIRDAVIAWFSDRTVEELRGSEGMDRVKTALTHRLDEVVPGHRIRQLLITDFVMQ
jgi:flagellar FliL protein